MTLPDITTFGSLLLASYLLGSVATAVLVCRLLGLPDPRQQGSGNPGATNVLRIGGRLAGGLTLLGDMLKGLLPTLLAHQLGLDLTAVAAIMLAAFLGHLDPVFFGLRGGKGVATGLGGLLGLSLATGISALITWLIVFALFRRSSAAAISAWLLAPAWAWVWLQALHPSLLVLALALLPIWRHRTNIRRLLRGEEPRMGSPAANAP